MKYMEIEFASQDTTGPFSMDPNYKTLVSYYVEREKLEEAESLEGINRPGIYYLYGENRVFVDSTLDGYDSLQKEIKDKDFWTVALLFLFDESDCTSTFLKQFAEYLVEELRENTSYKIENKSSKRKTKPISKSEVLELYTVIDGIFSFITSINLSIASSKPKISTINKIKPIGNEKGEERDEPKSITRPTALIKLSRKKLFHTSKRGTKSYMYLDEGMYVVKSGSEIYLKTVTKDKKIKDLRLKGLLDGKIVRGEKGEYITVTHYSFSSPSEAADFVLGGSNNGWIKWVDEEGNSLEKCLKE